MRPAAAAGGGPSPPRVDPGTHGIQFDHSRGTPITKALARFSLRRVFTARIPAIPRGRRGGGAECRVVEQTPRR